MTENNPLSIALYGPTDPSLRPLPESATALLRQLECPPRLAIHLRIVHDVATQVADWMSRHYPALVFDREAVLFGAATHDIGKTIHVNELVVSGGKAHEEAGPGLLRSLGVSPRLARFAGTHSAWHLPGITVEDLMVSLADKSWKSKRKPDLEVMVIAELTRAAGGEEWEHFLALDELLTRIGRDSDRRIALQSSFPVDTVHRRALVTTP
ncbi:MAG TPA: HD domain-containing protein [Actinocrinis sp.]|nr:HD domain-containing protein [Actinocrinis sp.]